MELHQLRYFVAVAETGSFGRAATRCHVSQPSLSQQVMKLEARLGRKLFDRLGRGIALTEAGAALLPRAKAILIDVLEAERELIEDAGPNAGSLTVGAIPTIAPYLLPGVIRDFLTSYPRAEISVREEFTEELVDALTRAELDLALMSLPLENDRVAHETLMEEPLLVVAPLGTPLEKTHGLDIRDLDDQPAIVLRELHCLSNQVQSFCTSHHVQFRIVCRTTQLTTVQSLVALGLGVSIVPEMCAIADQTNQLVYLAMSEPTARRAIVVAWHPGRHRSRLTEQFLVILRRECRDREQSRSETRD